MKVAFAFFIFVKKRKKMRTYLECNNFTTLFSTLVDNIFPICLYLTLQVLLVFFIHGKKNNCVISLFL